MLTINSNRNRHLVNHRMLRASFLLAFVLCLNIVNANTSSPSNSTSSINMKLDEIFNVTATSSAYSLVKVYEVQNNSLRKGFEPFYYISNQVIDYITPSSLSEILGKVNGSLFSSIEKVADKQTLDKSYLEYGILAFKTYPSLTAAVVVSVLIGILIPLFGFILCSYRLCCKPKFNPFDGKFDSIKRKANATFIFVLLVCLLIAIVILFFTNQSSSMVVNKMPRIANESLDKLDQFLSNDMKNYLTEAKTELKTIKVDSDQILDATLQKSFIKVFKRLDGNLGQLIDEITNNLNNVDNDINQVRLSTIFSNNPNIETSIINKLNEAQMLIKNGIVSLNSVSEETTVNRVVTEKLKKEFHDLLNKKIDLLINGVDLVTAITDPASESLRNTQSLLNAKPVNDFLTYYQYFYYALMGISIFMLLLFVLYSLGLAGMCTRRMHNSYRQTCHRGISARFFLAAISLFFIFSWVIMVVCVVLFVPGITLRHSVCKPVIELEDNKLFNELRNFDEFNYVKMVNFKNVLSVCALTNNQTKFTSNLVNQIKKEFIDKNDNALIEQLNLTSLVGMDFIEKIELSSIQSEMSILQRQIMDNINNLDPKINELIEGSNVVLTQIIVVDPNRKLVEQLRDSAKKLKASLIEFNQKDILGNIVKDLNNNQFIRELIRTAFNETIIEFTVPEFKRAFFEKAKKILVTMPSCRPISDVYGAIVVTSCFEFLDNYNTYWFTLLIVFFIYFIMSGFALSQADLFRKYYSYDEILSEEEYSEYKEPHRETKHNSKQYDMFHAKPQRGGVIDAYEMQGYVRKYDDRGSSRSAIATPPPQYRGSRH